MITGSLLLALSLAVAPADAGASQSAQSSGRFLKFIGEQVSFESIDCIVYRWDAGYEDPYAYEDGDEAEVQVQNGASTECKEDDLHNRARYRVLKTIGGEVGETVDFLTSDWTSYYAESRHALIYVLESPDGALLPPGLAVSVYPTVDNDWASCDADKGSEPLEFAGDLVFGRTDGMSPHGISLRFPSTDYLIIGQEAFCIRGRRLPALIDDLESEIGNLREQGFPHIPKASVQDGSP